VFGLVSGTGAGASWQSFASLNVTQTGQTAAIREAKDIIAAAGHQARACLASGRDLVSTWPSPHHGGDAPARSGGV